MKVLVVIALACIATVRADKAPYPAAGTKPVGPIFLLPVKPAPAAPGTPSPNNVAGYPYPARVPTTPSPDATATTASTKEVEIVTPNTTVRNPKQEVLDVGVYYILSPNGKLQKVEYFTAPQPQSEIAQKLQEYDVKGDQARQFKFNGVVTNFQYKDVEPVSAPIYSYNNVPGPLVRILRQSDTA